MPDHLRENRTSLIHPPRRPAALGRAIGAGAGDLPLCDGSPRGKSSGSCKGAGARGRLGRGAVTPDGRWTDFLRSVRAAARLGGSVNPRLLAEADLSSFLTSFGYEGYGLPPGEAIASGVAYISSTYELYGEVYESKGFQAPLLPISRVDDELPTEGFVTRIFDLLVDADQLRAYADFNFTLGSRLLSIEALERRLEELLPTFGLLRKHASRTCRSI